MICFKDRTFCSSDCIKTKCWRFFDSRVQQEADAWWNGFDSKDAAPIAFSDFSDTCPEYEAPPTQEKMR